MASRVMVTRATRLSTALSPSARASRTSSCAIEAASRANAGVRAFPHSSRSAHAWLSNPVSRAVSSRERRKAPPENYRREDTPLRERLVPGVPRELHRQHAPLRDVQPREVLAVLRDAQLGERRAVRLEERVELLELKRLEARRRPASAETSIARDAARRRGRGETHDVAPQALARHRTPGKDGRRFVVFVLFQIMRINDAKPPSTAAARAAWRAPQPRRDHRQPAPRARAGHGVRGEPGSVAAPTPLITTPDASNATTANAWRRFCQAGDRHGRASGFRDFRFRADPAREAAVAAPSARIPRRRARRPPRNASPPKSRPRRATRGAGAKSRGAGDRSARRAEHDGRVRRQATARRFRRRSTSAFLRLGETPAVPRAPPVPSNPPPPRATRHAPKRDE